jgi:hypothetical protein
MQRSLWIIIVTLTTSIHPQVSLSSEETVKAKNAFEILAASYGVRIMNYHADNGRFQDNAWKNDCENKAHGVNAHWKNGKAEKKIRDLQDSARTICSYML